MNIVHIRRLLVCLLVGHICYWFVSEVGATGRFFHSALVAAAMAVAAYGGWLIRDMTPNAQVQLTAAREEK